MITPPDLALEIFEELGSPASTNTASIETWIINNLYALNTLIDAEYASTSATTEITDSHRPIIKLLYGIRFYENLANSYYGAAGAVDLLEVTSDGGKVRLANKNELIKTLQAMIKELRGQLKYILTLFKNKNQTIGVVFGIDSEYVRLPKLGLTDEDDT